MTDQPELTANEALLRQDLMKEYYALQDQLVEHDGRMMAVKGWSVTLSLAALTLGFQTGHYALFALAALTAGGFWFLNGLLKGYQLRNYSRIREIEVVADAMFGVDVPGMGRVSSPQINWSWFRWGSGRPERRTPEEEASAWRRRFTYPNVMAPHVVAVLLGIVLFVAAALELPGLRALAP
ncbi:hypothetical protein [Microbacterium aurum]